MRPNWVPESKVHGADNEAHLGPDGPRWAPCWPHEPCYQGLLETKWWLCMSNDDPSSNLQHIPYHRRNVYLRKYIWRACPLLWNIPKFYSPRLVDNDTKKELARVSLSFVLSLIQHWSVAWGRGNWVTGIFVIKKELNSCENFIRLHIEWRVSARKR